jgi:hypothetical protein
MKPPVEGAKLQAPFSRELKVQNIFNNFDEPLYIDVNT